MVDSIVVGRFVGKNALAAIGATQSVLFLIVCLIIGLTMGTCILVSQSFGGGAFEKIQKIAGWPFMYLLEHGFLYPLSV